MTGPDPTWSDPLEGLPLVRGSDPAWAEVALGDLPAVLCDHAHCEQKAAASALRMIAQFPGHRALLRPMLALAQEELRHFRQVLDRLEAAGGALTHPRPDRYAGAVRRASCTLPEGLGDLGDVLVASAFIEARSCERFRLLAEALADEGGNDDDEWADLAVFYRRLADAEGRHWTLFRDLARQAVGAERADRRIAQVAEEEARITADLPLEPRMH